MQDFQALLAKLWGTCEEWFYPFILGCAVKFGAIMASNKLPSLRILLANTFFGGVGCVVAYHFSREWKLPLWATVLFMVSGSIVGYTLFIKVNKKLERKLDEGLEKLLPIAEKKKDD